MPKKPSLKIAEAEADADIGSIIGVLTDTLAAAREGKIRSVFLALTAQDGSVTTRWSSRGNDGLELVGLLTALQHDILSERS